MSGLYAGPVRRAELADQLLVATEPGCQRRNRLTSTLPPPFNSVAPHTMRAYEISLWARCNAVIRERDDG